MNTSACKKSVLILVPAILILAYGVFRTSAGLEAHMDIRFYDESYYLCQGLFQPIASWVADYSVLYSLFYKGLSLIAGTDAVSLYYLSYRIWAFVLAFLVFFILWKRGVHLGLCMVWALCSLSAEINYPLWPKAGHLAMLGVALALFGMQKLGSKNPAAWLWNSGICLLLSWCRPEFLAGFIPGIAVFFVLVFRNRKAPFSFPFWVVLPVLVSLVCIGIWGIPGGDSGRGLVAFGQHYVHNWRNISGRNQGDLMWDWVNWREIFYHDFPGASNFFEALLINPSAFFSHIFFNAKYLIYKAFVYFFESLIPNRWLALPVNYTVAFCWLLLEISEKFEGAGRWLRQYRPLSGRLFHPVWILIFPSFLSGLLFQPRPHYLIPWFPVFLWVLGGFLSCFTLPQIGLRWKKIFSFASVSLILILLPDASAFFQIQEKGSHAERSFLSSFNFFEPETREDLRQKLLIRQLQELPWPAQTVLFDASTGAADFLGTRVERKGKTGFEMNYDELSDFESFIKKEKVNAIFIRPSTIHYDRQINAQPFWQKLRARPATEGWRKLPVGTFGDSLLIRP